VQVIAFDAIASEQAEIEAQAYISPNHARRADLAALAMTRRLSPPDPLPSGAALAFLGGCLLGLLSAVAMGWLA
jgi:hypothetical protein